MEDFLKDKATEYKITPKVSTWEGIESKLLQKKKKRVLWFYTLSGFIIVLLVAYTVFQFQPDTAVSSNPELASESMEEKAHDKQEPVETIDKTQNTEAQSEAIASTEPIVEPKVELATKKVNTEPISVSPQLKKYLEKRYNKTNQNRMGSGDSQGASEKGKPSQGPDTKVARTRQHNLDSVKEEKRDGQIAEVIDSAKTSGTTVDPVVQVQAIPTPVDSLYSRVQPSTYFNPYWSLAVNYGYGRSFYRTNDGDIITPPKYFSSQAQTTITQAAEEPGSSYSVATRINYHPNKNWSFGAGITFQKISWLGAIGDLAPFTLDKNGTKVIGDTVFTMAGNREFVSVDLRNGERGFESGNLSFTSQARFLSLPLNLGYTYNFRPKLSLVANIGLSVHHVQEISFLQYYNGLNTYIMKNEESEGINKWSASSFVSLGMGYQLSNRLGLFIGADYQQFISLVQQFEDSQPSTRRPYISEGKIGISYSFH
jgi:hypothetical protein